MKQGRDGRPFPSSPPNPPSHPIPLESENIRHHPTSSELEPIAEQLTILARRILRDCHCLIDCPLCKKQVPIKVHHGKVVEGCEHLKGTPFEVTVKVKEASLE